MSADTFSAITARLSDVQATGERIAQHSDRQTRDARTLALALLRAVPTRVEPGESADLGELLAVGRVSYDPIRNQVDLTTWACGALQALASTVYQCAEATGEHPASIIARVSQTLAGD